MLLVHRSVVFPELSIRRFAVPHGQHDDVTLITLEIFEVFDPESRILELGHASSKLGINLSFFFDRGENMVPLVGVQGGDEDGGNVPSNF